VDCFIFDCDGVIWRGDSVIDGVPETLDMLRAMVRPGAPSPCLPVC
jgi:phosphoglycolate phosphatase